MLLASSHLFGNCFAVTPLKMSEKPVRICANGNALRTHNHLPAWCLSPVLQLPGRFVSREWALVQAAERGAQPHPSTAMLATAGAAGAFVEVSAPMCVCASVHDISVSSPGSGDLWQSQWHGASTAPRRRRSGGARGKAEARRMGGDLPSRARG